MIAELVFYGQNIIVKKWYFAAIILMGFSVVENHILTIFKKHVKNGYTCGNVQLSLITPKCTLSVVMFLNEFRFTFPTVIYRVSHFKRTRSSESTELI